MATGAEADAAATRSIFTSSTEFTLHVELKTYWIVPLIPLLTIKNYIYSYYFH